CHSLRIGGELADRMTAGRRWRITADHQLRMRRAGKTGKDQGKAEQVLDAHGSGTGSGVFLHYARTSAKPQPAVTFFVAMAGAAPVLPNWAVPDATRGLLARSSALGKRTR